MTVSSGASTVFNWLSNLNTLATLLTWVTILTSYLRFRSGLDAQGVDRSTMKFRAIGGRFTAWFALIYFSVVIIGNGFSVFTSGRWNASDFIVAYIGIVIYLVLYTGWKVFKRTPFSRSLSMDLWSGKQEIDAQDDQWVEPKPRNMLEKVWMWLV